MAATTDQLDSMDPRLVATIREIFRHHYAFPHSVRGWLFACLIDHEYIDSTLERSHARNAGGGAQAGGGGIVAGAAEAMTEASAYLGHIAACRDIAQKYGMLEALTALGMPELTVDSYAAGNDADLSQRIAGDCSGEYLNIVIIGAGPAGLTLASALKLAFGERINIVVIENRVEARHYKKPYGRRWIAHIPLSFLSGMIEEEIAGIFSQVGGKYIGVTIDILESLLLLSCRRMGVKFLFQENYDLSFVARSKVQAIFDASGGRFNKIDFPPPGAPITVGREIETASLNSNDAKIAPYGIRIKDVPDNKKITVGSSGNIFFPLYKSGRMKVALLKVIHLPVALYDVLLQYIVANNGDNKFYIWPGDLKQEINQAILTVNLRKGEYEALCGKIASSAKVDELLRDEVLMARLDSRMADVLRIIAGHAANTGKISIEPPFLFEPYLIDLQGNIECIHGKPVIRIGDAIFNGNVKHGNGLGSHLVHIRHIHNAFVKNFGF
ncbi:MAG: hypothetical protein AB1513_10460 [Pseudomonadota bacterium]